MRHRKKKITLDRKKGPREMLLRQLATSVILYEQITTTKAKAKAVQPLVDRMVTLGKASTVLARRRLAAVLLHRNAVNKVLEVLSPRYKTRHGGYTRITRLNRRHGDGAEMASLAFVSEEKQEMKQS